VIAASAVAATRDFPIEGRFADDDVDCPMEPAAIIAI